MSERALFRDAGQERRVRLLAAPEPGPVMVDVQAEVLATGRSLQPMVSLDCGPVVARLLVQTAVVGSEPLRPQPLSVAEQRQTGRDLLRILLRLHAQVDEQEIHLFVHGTGQPYAIVKGTPYGVSISHSRGRWYAAALPRGSVGIDAEFKQGFPATRYTARFALSAWEQQQLAALEGESAQAFLRRRWTLKEAHAKTTGEGLRFPFPALSFEDPEQHNLTNDALTPLMGTDGPWTYWSTEDVHACTVALCWRNTA